MELLRTLIIKHFNQAEFVLLCDDFAAVYPTLKFELENNISTSLNYEARVHATLKWLESRSEYEALTKFEQFIRKKRPELLSTPATTPILSEPIIRLNPFGTMGKMNDLRYFVVRQPFTRYIWEELSKGVNLSIVGDQQTGKSSLLHYIVTHGPRELNRSASDFVYLDMQLVSREEEFFNYLCEELGINFDSSGRLAQQLKNRSVVVCLDEIEQMKKKHFQDNARGVLRSLAGGATAPLTLVITSRTELAKLFPDNPNETSPLAGIFYTEKLRPFTLAEVQELVRLVLVSTPHLFTSTEIEQVYHVTKGHPGHVQQELKLLFRQKYP